MGDALFVRRFERIGNLTRVVQRRFERLRTVERFSVHQFHHQCAILDRIDLRNVWMIQRRQHPGLAREPRHAVGVWREGLRQDFDGHVAAELSVGRAPDFAHATLAQLGGDVVVRNGGRWTHPLGYGMISHLQINWRATHGAGNQSRATLPLPDRVQIADKPLAIQPAIAADRLLYGQGTC